MKLPHPIFPVSLAALAFFCAAPANAATEAPARPTPPNTGTVAGRVQNVATGQYLNNAQVAVKDTTLVAFTDQTGTYRLSSVPSGPILLEVFLPAWIRNS